MNRSLRGIIVGSLLTGLSASTMAGESNTQVAGNNEFAIAIYKQLDKDKENQGKNLFLSPYSISTAFAMTYMGARGNTAKEMKEVLHFQDDKATSTSFKDLANTFAKVQEKGKVKLSTANSIWAQSGYGFLPEFLEKVNADFGSELKQANFKQEASREQARREINTWVEGKTNDKIKNLVAKGILNRLTRMVLVNAIYFKGDWASQFKTANTMDRPFFKGDSNQAKVPTMYQKESFRYAEDKDVQVLEMPYEGNDLSMLVVLPKKRDGLKDLTKNLTADQLDGWAKHLRKRKVEVYFPKFKVEYGLSLKKTMISLGMKDAFWKSDFSGMDGTKNLVIQDAIHKAFVEVDEKGTEAAAATAVIVGLRCATIKRDPVFRADHPFLYLIRHNETGSILFMGHLNNP